MNLDVICINGIIFLPRLVPPFGYTIENSGYVYLIAGAAIIVITKWMDCKYRFKNACVRASKFLIRP